MMTSRLDRRAIAHHEAGHAVVAWLYAKPGSVSAVLVNDAGGSAGFTFCDLAGAALWARYGVSLAGPLATAVYASTSGLSIASEPPEIDQASLARDLEDAGAVGLGDSMEPVILPEALASIEGEARPRSIEARTLRLLRRHWAAVEAIALALEAQGRLSPREVTRICNRHGLRRLSL
jgi:hypothetical protein